jgi:hypothetical protein
MTLATLPRSLVIPRSPARSRVAAAAAELQRAIDQLFEEAKEQARERARRDAENEAKAQAHVANAKARAATANLRIEVDRKWFWSFCNEMLDTLRAVSADAKRRGEQGDARMIERVIDDACTQLEKIQAKEARP